jgi:hypothetical protein
LNPSAILNLEKKIKGSLLNCFVKDNWPQFESFSKNLEAVGNETLKHKKEWLDINDIFVIFYDFVFEAVMNKADKDEKLEGNLWDLLGNEDAQKLLRNIIEYFISIPREFDVYIPLPRISQNLPANINLIENMSLEVYEEANKVPGGYQGELLGLLNSSLELKKAYWRQRISGYCGNRLENSCNKKAINNFKIILQQGVSRKLFKEIPDKKSELGLYGGYSHHQVPKVHLVSIDLEIQPQKILKTEFPLDFSKWINSIDLNWGWEPLEKAKADAKLDQFISETLKTPAELIECEAVESIRVKSAIKWCFDSYISENQTLAFLQICIALEALLGDEGYKGFLTEILADRCSYLISDDIKRRKNIKNNFKKLYDIRSKLVHGNATELDGNQELFLNWGRSVLEFAINKEIKHLNLGKT